MKVDFHFDNDGDHDRKKDLPVILVFAVVIIAELCVLALLFAQMWFEWNVAL